MKGRRTHRKPCPFCGKRRIHFHDVGCAHVMICAGCGAYGPALPYEMFRPVTAANRAAALEAWNLRAGESS